MSSTTAKAPESAAQQDFNRQASAIARAIGDRPLDAALEAWLNATYPPDGKPFRALAELIREGAEEGWLCQREAGGIRFSRPIKPGQAAGRFSVDVVYMDNVKGPHHVHTTGEIGMIVPVKGEAAFDGKGEGWYVYEPGSAHSPTVTGGAAYVMYYLPDGAIAFTGR
jgi:hypothetical protein